MCMWVCTNLRRVKDKICIIISLILITKIKFIYNDFHLKGHWVTHLGVLR